MISIVDHTSKAKPPAGAVTAMAAAVQHQVVYDFCPAWGRTSTNWKFSRTGTIQALLVDDDASVPGALAYHDDQNGKPAIVILCKTILDAGGQWLTGGLSVASALSHEVLELIADAACNLAADDGRGQAYALEVCDPVEEHVYPVTVNGQTATVSDFVLPAWFDPTASGVRFDHLGILVRPFELSKGYAIVTPEGQSSQITGAVVPERHASFASPNALAFSRTWQRLLQHPSKA